MKSSSRALLALLLAAGCLFSSQLRAQDAFPSNTAEMAQHLDRLLASRWMEEGVAASPRSSDDEFMRRLYLDLTGATPSVAQARRFLDDRDPDKRRKLIDSLLMSPRFATHMANTWRNRLLPEGLDALQQRNAGGLQNWLREQFVDNLRYDNLVAEFLVATGAGQRGPGVFYTALEMKPEKLAANTARIFLGLQIQCAECHDHPFDHWTQRDFWGYAAFFARLEGPTEGPAAMNMRIRDLSSGDVTLPETEEVIAPKYPAGRLADPSAGGTRRRQLAIWMASRDNPFLPRAAVNWGWDHLFGRGLVHPVDDMSDKNPPSHPRLMDDLTRYFVRQGFDIRELFRVIANTRAYQLSSRAGADADPRPELFSRMAVKTLTPEQLYDSLSRTLVRQQTTPGPFGQVNINGRRQQFISRMQTQSRDVTEYEAGLPQALLLMNGPLIAEATNQERSALLGGLEAPFLNDAQRLEILFLATVSRRPTKAENERFSKYIKSGGPAGDSKKAMGDVLWALLNSAEFALNH